jgi:hypothetical protein
MKISFSVEVSSDELKEFFQMATQKLERAYEILRLAIANESSVGKQKDQIINALRTEIETLRGQVTATQSENDLYESQFGRIFELVDQYDATQTTPAADTVVDEGSTELGEDVPDSVEGSPDAGSGSPAPTPSDVVTDVIDALEEGSEESPVEADPVVLMPETATDAAPAVEPSDNLDELFPDDSEVSE